MTSTVNQDSNSLIAKKNIRIKVMSYENDTADEFITSDFSITDLSTNDEVDVHFPANIRFDAIGAKSVNILEDNDAILEYEEGDTIGEIVATATDTTSAVMAVQSVMNHAGDRYEKGEDIVLELYELFRNSSKIPLVFFEILVSQLMRDSDRPHYPYRLGMMNKPPKFMNIKSIASVENPKRGIMFEKVLDVITDSVLHPGNDKDVRLTSDLELLFDI